MISEINKDMNNNQTVEYMLITSREYNNLARSAKHLMREFSDLL